LTLFVPRVFADDPNDTFPLDQLAFVANALDAGPHFHDRTVAVFVKSRKLRAYRGWKNRQGWDGEMSRFPHFLAWDCYEAACFRHRYACIFYPFLPGCVGESDGVDVLEYLWD
jgi:hypothetical protein